MKGEGEVKLNMTVGKGEQMLKHNSVEGQEIICTQLQSLKDAWANMLMTSMSCHRWDVLSPRSQSLLRNGRKHPFCF